jgi:hypothetical protein
MRKFPDYAALFPGFAISVAKNSHQRHGRVENKLYAQPALVGSNWSAGREGFQIRFGEHAVSGNLHVKRSQC